MTAKGAAMWTNGRMDLVGGRVLWVARTANGSYRWEIQSGDTVLREGQRATESEAQAAAMAAAGLTDAPQTPEAGVATVPTTAAIARAKGPYTTIHKAFLAELQESRDALRAQVAKLTADLAASRSGERAETMRANVATAEVVQYAAKLDRVRAALASPKLDAVEGIDGVWRVITTARKACE